MSSENETLTITRAQFMTWILGARAGQCLWSSLKEFVDGTPEKTQFRSLDRSAIASMVFEICEIRGVTPYNLVWHDSAPRAGLEVVFLEDPPESLRSALRIGIIPAAAGEIELLFSKWDGHR